MILEVLRFEVVIFSLVIFWLIIKEILHKPKERGLDYYE